MLIIFIYSVLYILLLICFVYLLFDSFNKNKNYKNLVLIGTVVFVVMSFIGFIYIINFYPSSLSSRNNDWGQFGSYFGGVLGPILSFITILLLLWNIYTQNQESKKNNFDKMFTLMLEQHNDYLDKSTFSEGSKDLYKELFELIDDSDYNPEQINDIFKKYPIINTYLRLLYRVLKYLTEENQATSNYSRLLRSFCSEELLFIIAANSLRMNHHNGDYDDYKSLLEKTNFLEHINLSNLYRKWSQHITQTTILLKKMEIQNNNSIFCVKNDFDSSETAIDGPFNEEGLIKYINEKIISTDNLFLDIMKIDSLAFNNSSDYNNYTNQIVISNKLLRETWKNKLNILKAPFKK